MRHAQGRSDAPLVVVQLEGELAESLADYAREKVEGLLARHDRQPALHVRVRLVRHGNPAQHLSVTGQVNVDLNGRFIRVQAAAATPREAVDRLVDRLRHRLERVAVDWEARRGGRYHRAPHEWRHDAPPTQPKPYFPLPPEDRQLIRHKTISPAFCSIDEAVADMNDLDHDFHLFTEANSGIDSVIYRVGPQLRLAQIAPTPGELGPHTAEVTVSEQPAPVLDIPEAIKRLRLTELPFLFFLDAEHGRGSVLYRRYDGHYGLIDAPPEPASLQPHADRGTA
jgi:hypothetical protein